MPSIVRLSTSCLRLSTIQKLYSPEGGWGGSSSDGNPRLEKPHPRYTQDLRTLPSWWCHMNYGWQGGAPYKHAQDLPHPPFLVRFPTVCTLNIPYSFHPPPPIKNVKGGSFRVMNLFRQFDEVWNHRAVTGAKSMRVTRPIQPWTFSSSITNILQSAVEAEWSARTYPRRSCEKDTRWPSSLRNSEPFVNKRKRTGSRLSAYRWWWGIRRMSRRSRRC